MKRIFRVVLAATTTCLSPLASGAAPAVGSATDAASAGGADTVFRNGKVYTVDAQASLAQAVAVREGRIVYVGPDAGVARWVGPGTRQIDLGGRFLMPGLVDGHMHPMGGGAQVRTCNLDYQPLTLAQMRERIQSCLDAAPGAGVDDWLQVSNWFRQFMRPAGTDATRETLDALRTKRPILVTSSDYHTALVNSRGIELAGIDARTPDPQGGKVVRDSNGVATGILEDDARSFVWSKLPVPTHEEQLAAGRAALDQMRRQGVTSFLDAAASPESLAVFAELRQRGELTARAHFAPVVEPEAATDPQKAVAAIQSFARTYDQGAPAPAPGLTVRNAKIFMDGVLNAPAFTAGMLAPYYINSGTSAHPHWQPGANSGPVYFAPTLLQPLVLALARAGFDPHVHAIGDRAVRETLDAFEKMRAAVPGVDVRPSIAHDEEVDPADFPRFAALGVQPVMSYQWAKPGPDSIDNARSYLGPERFSRMEPEGSLYAAGARIAFGSDWPVDSFNEWFAFQVAATRMGDGSLGPAYDGVLNAERALPVAVVLRSATLDSSYELHQDGSTGSIEAGKLADLIVLDRSPLAIAPAELGKVRVLLTMVGGKLVWQDAEF